MPRVSFNEVDPSAPPSSEQELLSRARQLAGRTIGQVSDRFGLETPRELLRAKGFVGSLIERALGARAASRPEPDFAHLGVEMKTIPIDRDGRPLESTYVTRVEMVPGHGGGFETSVLHRKLQRVLWIPIEAERSVPVASRRVGTAFLWSPGPSDEAQLRLDYEELLGLVADGFVDSITARRGKILQVRPKAASSRVRGRGVDEQGGTTRTLPRGFYLRRSFTLRMLADQFRL